MSLAAHRCRWALGPRQYPHNCRVTCRPDTRFERATNTRQATKTRQSMADSYQNIGIVNQHQGIMSAVTEMYKKAYHTYMQVLGPDHPLTQGIKPFVEKSSS